MNQSIEIAILDREVNPILLNQLITYDPKCLSIYQSQNYSLSTLPTHGTLCLALLIEALENRVKDKYHITYWTIKHDDALGDIFSFLYTLKNCVEYPPDLLLLSVGFYNRMGLQDLDRFFGKLDHTVAICASSNKQRLTFPASLDSVIGVKTKWSCGNQPYIERVKNPVDGIELSAWFPESAVMRKLRLYYNYPSQYSNSILPPQLCGIAANSILKHKTVITKENIMNALSQSVCEIPLLSQLSRFDTAERGDLIPIVGMCYSSIDQIEVVFEKARQIQNAFANDGYPCSLVCDFLIQPDYPNGIHVLDKTEPNNHLVVLEHILSDSLILATINEKNIKNMHLDYILYDYTQSIDVIKGEILLYFAGGNLNEK